MWTDGTALKEEEAPVKPLASMDYVFTRHDIGFVSPAVFALAGMVNSGALISNFSGFVFGTETLLLNQPTIEVIHPYLRSTSAVRPGTAHFRTVYRFTHRPWGWNYYWRAESQSFEQIQLKEGGIHKNFPAGDFTQL
jgi:hypothetical protein